MQTLGCGPTAIYEYGTYENDWTADSISQATHPDLYLNLTIQSPTTLDLEVIDATTWTTLYNVAFSVSSSYGFNTTGSGEGLYRFDSIAQTTEALSDGSYGDNYNTSSVYEYNPSTYQLVTSYGAEAGAQCDQAEQATIGVNSSTPWYQDSINITY